MGTPNLSANLSVSPGAPTRKSHCRWIRVFRYICSYLQTGKYKFTTSQPWRWIHFVCFFAFFFFFRREKKETQRHASGYLSNFIKINRSSVFFYCQSVISFCKTVFSFILFFSKTVYHSGKKNRTIVRKTGVLRIIFL